MTLLTYTIVTLKFYKMVSNQRWTSRHRQNHVRKIVLHSPALIQHAKHNTVLLIRIECQLSSVSVTENQFTDNISFTGCSDEHMDSCWFNSQKYHALCNSPFAWKKRKRKKKHTAGTALKSNRKNVKTEVKSISCHTFTHNRSLSWLDTSNAIKQWRY